jgi:hypothetical protein
MVKEALEQSLTRRNSGIFLKVPWDKFIFSTRNGQPYMPPSLQKGLDNLPSYMRDGVNLTVRHTDDQSAGHFTRGTMELVSPLVTSTIAHETLHFVQFVGQVLLQLGQGHGPDWASARVMRDGQWVVSGSAGGKKSRPYDTMEYGMPKKRALTRHYRPADGGAHGQDASEHGLRDIEFMSNALSVAHTAALSPLNSPEQIAETLYSTVHFFYPGTTAKFSPQRLRDFYSAMWGYAVQRLVEQGAPASKYPPTPTPAIWPILSGQVSPSRERALKELAEYDRRMERKRRRGAAEAVSPPRPARPASPPPRERPAALPPAAVRGEYRVVREMVNGREVFSVYKGSTPTGKYAFSEDKARAIMGKLK